MRNSPVPGSERYSDVLDSLLDLVEGSYAPFEQRVAVLRRFDALRVAVEETHADRLFQLGDRSGNGGLGCVEERGRLAHAASLHNGRQNVEVMQLDPTSNPIVRLHGEDPSQFCIGVSKIAFSSHRSPGASSRGSAIGRILQRRSIEGNNDEYSAPSFPASGSRSCPPCRPCRARQGGSLSARPVRLMWLFGGKRRRHHRTDGQPMAGALSVSHPLSKIGSGPLPTSPRGWP